MLLSASVLHRFFERVCTKLSRRHGGARQSRGVAHRPYWVVQIAERLEDRKLLSAMVGATLENYAAGATAVINATDFAVGETVEFEVDHIDGEGGVIETGGAEHDPWQVVDGSENDLDGVADGHIKTTWYLNPDDSAGATFRLTATGLTSGATATDMFTGAASLITNISPNSGPAAGGQPVTITGGFSAFNTYAVTFGSGPSAVTVAATLVVPEEGANYLTAITPAHAWGIVDVTVTTMPSEGAPFSASLIGGYTYEEGNRPPTGTVDNPSVSGAAPTNTGSFFDAEGDTVTLSASLGAVTKIVEGEIESQRLWSWSINPEDIPAVSTLVTIYGDDDGDGPDAPVAITTFWLRVDNAAPTITSSVVGLDGCGAIVTGSITITDPGVDSHTVLINWGDGSDPDGDSVVGETFVIGQSESTGETSFSLAGLHTYTAFGAHTITAKVTDSYGASSSTVPLGSVTVGATASVTYDPVWGITLDIHGTDLADHITVNQTGGGSQIKVHSDSGPDMVFSAGPYTIVSPTGPNNTFETHTGNIAKIRMHLCDGDDQATISSGVDIGAIIFGEGGNDHINAGKANAIILGGDGDDDLVGGAGIDVLIGGNGADRIVGSAGDDLLIAGYTSYDNDADGNDAVNQQALKAILSVWNTIDSYVNRVVAVQNTNAPYNLLVDTATTGTGNREQTVFSDNDEDKLTGSADYDLFFANLVADDDVATVLDKITDLNSKLHETGLDIDWA